MHSSGAAEVSPTSQVVASHTFGVDLCIVPIDSVLPHEAPDPGRVARLSERLRDDGLLRDPVMVGRVPNVSELILLDGTNRQAALRRLGFERILAQVVEYEDRGCVNLLTWAHLVDLPQGDLLARVAAVRGVRLEPVLQADADNALVDHNSLAAIHFGPESHLVSRLEKRASRAELLLAMVETYEPSLQRETRDAESIAEKLEEVRTRPGGHESVLVTFPRLTRRMVVDLATKRALIPAGITRHVIRCGRALRVNVPLTWLSGDLSLEAAETSLDGHLGQLRPRRYLEPTVLFDS